MAYTLIELPLEILASFLFALLMLGVGLIHDVRGFFEFVVTAWAQQQFGESIGILCCSVLDNEGLSVA